MVQVGHLPVQCFIQPFLDPVGWFIPQQAPRFGDACAETADAAGLNINVLTAAPHRANTSAQSSLTRFLTAEGRNHWLHQDRSGRENQPRRILDSADP